MNPGQVLLVGVVGAWVARAQLLVWLAQTADRQVAPSERWSEVTGARVHHRRTGDGPPVLFVHGFAGDGRTFARVVASASARYECIVVDRPGHGRSTRGRTVAAAAPTVQAAQLDEVMAWLGHDRYLVVCHSWGCYVGLALARTRPSAVAGLVLVNCVAFNDGRGSTRVQPRALTLLPVVGPALWRTIASASTRSFAVALGLLFRPEPVDERFVADVTPSVFLHPGHVRSMTQDFKAAAAEVPRLAGGYGGIVAPVVLLAGDQDAAAPVELQARPLHELLPQSRLHVEPGAGHMLPVTRPEAVLAALDEVAAAARAGEVDDG
jgi:pimeloyl-ACP methyl ester carboxylesterase